MKIKLQEAKEIEAKINRLQTELMETLKLADAKGMVISQHVRKEMLDRYNYIISGVKVYPDDIEV